MNSLRLARIVFAVVLCSLLLTTAAFASSPTPTATPTATPTYDQCVWALDKTATKALSITGAAIIDSPGCGVVVDSTDSSAMSFSGSGSITAKYFDVAGGYSKSGAVTFSPTPQTHTTVPADPLSFLVPPTTSACTYTNYKVSTGTTTLNPGTYCNGIQISGATIVTFNPGMYILMGGGLTVSGASILKGTGVTFFLTQGMGYNYGPLSITGSAVLTLKAPTCGAGEGILFWQDPQVKKGSAASAITGATTSTLEGALYFPTTGITYNGAAAGYEGKYFAIVADTISITGSAAITNNYGGLCNIGPLAPPVAVSVTPTTATLYPSQTQQFTAAVTYATNTSVTWSLGPGGAGTISTGGLYTAPSTITSQQTVTVTATSVADPTKSASATITLMPPVTPVITWSQPAAITYGTPLSSTQLNATVNAPGTLVYTPASGTVLGAGTQTLSVVFTPANPAQYTAASASVKLTVNKATPVITWPAPAPITYGTPISATQLDASLSVPGSCVYTPAAGAVLPAGTQTLSVTCTPTDTTDYATPPAKTVPLTVNKAMPVITWPTPTAITYGTPLSATQLDAILSVPGTCVYTPPAGTVLPAGTQTLSVTCTPTDTTDYPTPPPQTVSLTVNKAVLTVTANSFTRTYGGANPTLTASYTGWVNGDTQSVLSGAPSLTTTATASSPVGSYAITAGAGTLTAANYSFTFVNGTLTVSKAMLTVTANNATRAYGAANPTFTASYAGFVNGDTLSVLSGAPSLTTTATASSPAGNYTITAAVGTLAAANYSFTFVNGTLTVTQGAAVITWPTPAAITYGTPLSATQLDASLSVPGTCVYTPPAGTVLPAGTQTLSVTCTPTDTTDYPTPPPQTVSLTVNKAVLTVTANSFTRTYGGANPTLTASYTGWVNGDTQSVLSGAPSLTTTATASSPVGSYAITAGAGTLTAANYSFTFVNGTLTVSKAMLTVTANNATRAYGAANPTFTASYAGFVNGDTLSVLSGAPSLTTTATASSPAGNYTITAAVGTLAAANYSFTFVNGTLTVTQGAAVITWPTPAAITYGTPLSATQLDASLSVPGTCVYTPPAGTVLPAGTQTLSVTCTPTDTTDYPTPPAQTVSLTVNKAVLTVTANSFTRTYGGANPTLTASYTGWVNGDTQSVLSGAPSLTTTATASSPAGNYTITAAVGTLTAANYSFTFVNGTLTVTQAITVSVSPASVTLSAGQQQTFTATVTGTTNTGVTWSAVLGKIDGNGSYTAPSSVTTQQTDTVTATSSADQTTTGQATVTLTPAASSCNTSGYAYSRVITIDHTKVPNTDQTNFPLLVSLTDPLLANVANGGHVTSANGYDIIFASDAAGANKLDHEIESYNPSNGQIIMWVRIPALSHTVDTTVYLVYGNATISSSQENRTGVWDSNFGGVWHLGGNGTTLSTADSTANGNNATIMGTASPTVGEIGYGAALTGSPNYIDAGNNPSVLPTHTGTMSAWVQFNAFSYFGTIIGNGNNGQNSNGALLYTDGGGNFYFDVDGPNQSSGISAGTLVTGQWYHLAGTWDGSTITLYMNGAPAGSTTQWNDASPAYHLNLGVDGALSGSGYYLNGSLDEVRVSSIARSPDWIATEYNNQSSPSTFYAISSENTQAIGVSPASNTLSYSQTQQFQATFVGACSAVTWTTSPVGVGTIDQTGLYTAPAVIPTQQTVTISATVPGSSAAPATATVVLMPITVSVAPSSLILYGSQTQQFTATVGNATNPAVTWSVSPSGVGSVDTTGLFRPSATLTAEQSITVTATSVIDPTQSASATVWLVSGAVSCAANSYAFERALVINHSKVANTDQVNFPVLVSLTDPAMASVGNGGHVASPNGYDIIFTSDAAGANTLDHEIESYNPATGQISMWVRIPTLSHTTDTTIFMWYGNASISSSQENKAGVWDSNFQTVLHMDETTGSTVFDSTENGNNGTYFSSRFSSPVNPVSGKIGGAQSFDGSSNFVEVPDSQMNGLTAFSLSLWTQTTDTLSGSTYNLLPTLVGDTGFAIDINNGDVSMYWPSTSGGNLVSSDTISDNQWHHIAAVNDGTAIHLYLDGQDTGVGLASGQPPTTGWWFNWLVGALARICDIGPCAQAFYQGNIGEFRFSNSARSADWIATEYNNQSSPSTFVTAGAEETGVIIIVPPTASLPVGGTQQFTAYFTGGCASAVTWSADVGEIDQNGLYATPPVVSAPEIATITAAPQASSIGPATATVGLAPLSISVSPTLAILISNQSAQFTATVAGATNTAVTWAVTPSGMGNVDDTGLYTAPGAVSTTQTITVTATSNADQTKVASAAITLLPFAQGCVSDPFPYVRAITVDHTKVPNTDQTNFPLLVNVTDPLLATLTNRGHVTSPNGYDILFATDEAGSNRLSYEIESYNPKTGELIAWVQLPTLSHNFDTTIYMLYGTSSITTSQENKAGLWGGTYSGVWHLDSYGELSGNDSTANANNGSFSSPAPEAVAGQIGVAASLSGVSSVDVATLRGMPTGNSPRTFSGWFTKNSSSDAGWIFSYGPFVTDAEWGLLVQDLNDIRANFWSDDMDADVTLTAGQWYYVVSTWDGTVRSLYLNGQLLQSGPGTPDTQPTDLFFGQLGDGTGMFNGNLNELRVATVPLSPDWIGAEYNNQHSPSTFYAIYGENLGITPPAATVYASGGTEQFSAELGSCGSGVTWSLSPAGTGTISSTGLYTAPATINAQQTVTVVATSQAQSASAVVTLMPPPGIAVIPPTAILHGGQSQQFMARVINVQTPAVWSIASNGLGSITSNGLYTAPPVIYTTQTVTVIATPANGSQAAAIITLVPNVTVSVTPPSTTLGPSQAQQFAANVLGTWNTDVTWTVSPGNMGTVTAAGLYTTSGTIPANATVTITATSSADPTASASATVTLVPVSSSSSIAVTPPAVTVSASQTQQFQAVVNGMPSTAITWAIGQTDPGSISSTGVYTAPADISTSQTATVTATTVSVPQQAAIATVTLTPSTTTGYLHRRPIVIDHTKVPNTDQVNFPVLISGTYSYLASIAKGGNVQNANGYDIIFDSDCTGDEKLDHEIESYNPQTGQVSMWVRIPYVSHTTDTVFYIAYGNSAITTSQENKVGVWDSNYQMVLHLAESAAPYLDSTSNAYSSTGGVPPAPVVGKIGGAQSFDGVAQYIAYAQAQSPNPTQSISMEAWVRTTDSSAKGILGKWLSDGSADATDRSYLMFYQAGGHLSGFLNAPGGGDVEVDGSKVINDGNWHHVAVTAPSTGIISVFVDGVLSGYSNNTRTLLASTPDQLLIGATSLATGALYMNGAIDEVRISNSVRSGDWIAAEVNNENSPSTFYTIYPENATIVSPANTVLSNSQSQQLTAIFTANAASASPLALLGAVQTPSSAHSIAVNGNLAYLCDDSEVSIVDITNPSNPVFLGTALSNSIANDGYAFCAIQHNSLVGFVDAVNSVIGDNPSFVAFDLTNPTQPQLIAGTNVNERFFSNTPAYVGNTALISTFIYTYYWGGWSVQAGNIAAVDISDFTNPNVVGTLSGNPVMGVTAFDQNTVFAGSTTSTGTTDRIGKLMVVNISNPAALSEILTSGSGDSGHLQAANPGKCGHCSGRQWRLLRSLGLPYNVPRKFDLDHVRYHQPQQSSDSC